MAGATGAPSAKIEGLDEALAAVRDKALADGRAEGYAAGRADAAKILASEGADKVPAFAAKLIGQPEIKPDLAASLVKDASASMPAQAKAADPGTFRTMMQPHSPDVGAAPDADQKAKSDRIEGLKAIGKAASVR